MWCVAMRNESLVKLIGLIAVAGAIRLWATSLPGCDVVMGQSAGSGLSWESSILCGAIVTEESEIHRIAGLSLVPGPLNSEIQTFLSSMGGLKALRTNPKL